MSSRVDGGYWFRRPFEDDALLYAAYDVVYLMPAMLAMGNAMAPPQYQQTLQLSRKYADHLRLSAKAASSSNREWAEIEEEEAAEEQVSELFLDKLHLAVGMDGWEVFLDALPTRYAEVLSQLDENERKELIDVSFDVGRSAEARFISSASSSSSPAGGKYRKTLLPDREPIASEEMQNMSELIGHFDSENRATLDGCLHRISAMRNRRQEVIGLTIRIGRTIEGLVAVISDILQEVLRDKKSVLLLGKPGTGKTSMLRELSAVLAAQGESVVVVDTANEIGGDGDVPHCSIGRARRMQVSSASQQHAVMIEAVQNHTPDVVIVDEIGTREEAAACNTIARRGVILIATAHGVSLVDLLNNPSLVSVLGGLHTVILSDRESFAKGLDQKTRRERQSQPAFAMAIELRARNKWVIHKDVGQSVDNLLRGGKAPVVIRTLDPETGAVHSTAGWLTEKIDTCL